MKYLKKLIIFIFIFLLFSSCYHCFAATSNTLSSDEVSYVNGILAANSNYTYYFAVTNGGTRYFFFTDASDEVKFYNDGTYLGGSPTDFTWYQYNYPSTSKSWSGPGRNKHGYGTDDFYSNTIVYTDNSFSEVFYTNYKNPYIANTAEDLATGKFDTILIQPGDSLITNSFDFVIRKISNVDSDGISYESQRIVYSTELNSSSSFFYQLDTDFWFEIPNDSLGINFQNDERYIFSLEKDGNSYQDITVTIGGLTDEDREANMLNSLIASNNKTTEAIKENTEVNKGIFEKIGEILSYINPFSENFFGKKLVDLILDGLKSLFVPEDGFFQSYFDEIQQWFSDRLGFLWTPFDIIIEVLERILNINFDEPIIKIPDIVEPFTGQKLISQQEYNLNSLLENEIFKNVHDIYFVCVDALIVFGLVNLTKKKIEEVFQN